MLEVRILPGALMFVLTALVYPGVLAVLCVGAGLAVDRASGGFLPGLLLPAVGAASLIAVAQLVAYAPPVAPAPPYGMTAVAAGPASRRGVSQRVACASPVAPATPYVMTALAAGGFALGRERVRTLVAR